MPHLKGRKKYAKLEQMSIEELEKLLALERNLPQEDRDTEFYDEVEEVLLQKVTDAPENRITNVDIAWKDFEKKYLPTVGTDAKGSGRESIAKKRGFRWGRLAVAAMLAVCILSSVIPPIFGAEGLFTVIGRWTDQVFSFHRNSGNIDASGSAEDFSENIGLQQLYASASNYIGDAKVIPTWIPDGFVLDSITITPLPEYQTINAGFSDGEAILFVQIVVITSEDAQGLMQYEKDAADVEIISFNGVQYYFMKNDQLWRCIWSSDNLECMIYGGITKDELYKIIHSIGGNAT